MKPIRKRCNLEEAAGLLYRLGFSFSLLFLLLSSSLIKVANASKLKKTLPIKLKTRLGWLRMPRKKVS